MAPNNGPRLFFLILTCLHSPPESLAGQGSLWFQPLTHWSAGKRARFYTSPLYWGCMSVSRMAGRVLGWNQPKQKKWPGWCSALSGTLSRWHHLASGAGTCDPPQPSPWTKPWRRWQDGAGQAPTETCKLSYRPAAGGKPRRTIVWLFAGWTAKESPPCPLASVCYSSLTGSVACNPETGSSAEAEWPHRVSATGRPKSDLSPGNLQPDLMVWSDLFATFHSSGHRGWLLEKCWSQLRFHVVSECAGASVCQSMWTTLCLKVFFLFIYFYISA